MLKNAYLDAKIGVDPAENEPPKECCVVGSSSGRCMESYGVTVLRVKDVLVQIHGERPFKAERSC